MEGKKYKVRINGALTTDTFGTLKEAMEWVQAFAKGVTEVVIESVDDKSSVGIREEPDGGEELLLS